MYQQKKFQKIFHRNIDSPSDIVCVLARSQCSANEPQKQSDKRDVQSAKMNNGKIVTQTEVGKGATRGGEGV